MIKRALNSIFKRLRDKPEEPSRQVMHKVEVQEIEGGVPPDDLLAQATCAVLVEGETTGTAWLLSDEGHLLTAGHLLCKDLKACDEVYEEVEVQFGNESPRRAHRVEWAFKQKKGVDFAILKLTEPVGRQPLPVSLARSVTGRFKLRGYGQALEDPATGVGEFVGVVDRLGVYRLFRFRSPELRDVGFSGGAVYSDKLNAVVAIQIEAGRNKLGPLRQTVLGMPLYRIAELSPEARRLLDPPESPSIFERVLTKVHHYRYLIATTLKEVAQHASHLAFVLQPESEQKLKWWLWARLALIGVVVLFLSWFFIVRTTNVTKVSEKDDIKMVSEKDGMTMLYVPAGEFLMGSKQDDAYDDEKPQHTVYLDAFWIDQTEVTNTMFTHFVEDTGYQTDAEKEEGWGWVCTNNGCNNTSPVNWRSPNGPDSHLDGLDKHPVVLVSWNDAKAYCEWTSRRLPTEAEWEKAARGTDGRIYPWGNDRPTCDLAQYGACSGQTVAVGS